MSRTAEVSAASHVGTRRTSRYLEHIWLASIHVLVRTTLCKVAHVLAILMVKSAARYWATRADMNTPMLSLHGPCVVSHAGSDAALVVQRARQAAVRGQLVAQVPSQRRSISSLGPSRYVPKAPTASRSW
jgi:hypothetical protein